MLTVIALILLVWTNTYFRVVLFEDCYQCESTTPQRADSKPIQLPYEDVRDVQDVRHRCYLPAISMELSIVPLYAAVN